MYQQFPKGFCKIMPTATQGCDQYFEQRQDACNPASAPAVNGIEQFVCNRNVSWMFFQVVD
jgi:hypothetical protein